jgi:hypothetical protein
MRTLHAAAALLSQLCHGDALLQPAYHSQVLTV